MFTGIQRNWMQSFRVCFPFYIAFIFLTFLVKDHAFFWDTVQLASRHAHWYFDNNFHYFFLPEGIDSGHPPFFGMMLAFMWKLFGKSLWVSHFMMLPFLLGILYFLYQLGEYYLGKGKSVYLLLLISVDPFFIGQSVLVSPDIVLVFGWLLALWSILSSGRNLLPIATLLLAAISMRGMMIVFSVFLFDLYRQYNNKLSWSIFLKTFLSYVPSGLFSLAFLYLHFKHSGWIGYHEASPWAPSFEPVSFQGIVRNIGLLGWRLLDFGRIFLWIIIFWGILKMIKGKIHLEGRIKEIVVLLFISLVVLTPSMLLHKGLMSHRYLLPIILLIDLLTIALLFKITAQSNFRKIIYFALFLGLFTGNFWVYPKQIAQGWDSTLAHLPYYDLRKEMTHFLDENKIPIDSVGTEFPMIGSMEILDLNGRKEGFYKKDIEKDSYILYSNVFNDFSDEELEKLETDFKIKKAFYRGQICMILYQRKE